MADRPLAPLAPVIDLELARAARLDTAVFGTVELVDGHVRISVQGDYTPAAAEAFAIAVMTLAGQAREEAKHRG